jgi:peptide/nickel transport system permease protein
VAAATVSAVAVRGLWGLTWRRFARDRWSVAAGCLFAAIVLASFGGGPVASALVGHSGTDLFPYAAKGDALKPVGPWTHVPALHQARTDQYGDLMPVPRTRSTLLVLGADGPLGRDELLRLLDGGRTSLEIGLGAVLVALLLGVPLGCAAGYFGGVTDAVVSRLTETVMAFPLILLLVFASVRLRGPLMTLAYGSVLPPGVVGVSLLIGIFTCFYPIRLVRAQLLALREAEFVQAAQMIGASNLRILRRHLLPHLVPLLLVWSAIAVATNMLLEVGISFIGAGVQASTATWGSLLSTSWGTLFGPVTYDGTRNTPWQTVFPTLAILLTVVSLNQVSEGVRRALDPPGR